MKQAPNQEPDLVSLSVRVSRQTANRLRAIAASEYRPVAAHIRRLIQDEVDRADAEPEKKAA